MPQVFTNNRATGTVPDPKLKRTDPKLKRMKAARVGRKLHAVPEVPVNRKQRRAAHKILPNGERTNGKTVD
jgi:hypothetical protein